MQSGWKWNKYDGVLKTIITDDIIKTIKMTVIKYRRTMSVNRTLLRMEAHQSRSKCELRQLTELASVQVAMMTVS